MPRLDQLRDSPWQTMKNEIRNTWREAESTELDRFEGEPGELVRYLHRQTDLDRNGLRLRLERLEERTNYSFH